MVYSPEPLVVDDRVKPEAEDRTVTVEPATGLPPSSVTTPRTVELVSCAFPATGTASIITATNAESTDPVNRDLLIIFNPRFEKKVRTPWATNVTAVFRSFLLLRPISALKAKNRGR